MVHPRMLEHGLASSGSTFFAATSLEDVAAGDGMTSRTRKLPNETCSRGCGD